MVRTTWIKVERNIETGRSGTNSPILSLVTVAAKLPADIQPNTSGVTFSESGQTVIADKLLFCGAADIREKDIITDLSDGIKYWARNCNKFALTHHGEIALKAGVI